MRAPALNRPSVFRLNIGVSRATYRSLFGASSSRRKIGDAPETGYDFTALDQLMPHPIYRQANWVCVLNPSAETFQQVLRPLLDEAYRLAAGKYTRRAARHKPD
ncbi:MAG TPA: DUF6194 family protein [Caldilineaceae bacterium]|nr:DUF6194 family protein [Caldilineaceae bacterium]